MSSNSSDDAARLRERLGHPVIDSDGHWVEFGPQLYDYLKRFGGSKAVEGFKKRPTEVWHLSIPLAERRERRLDQPIWWGMPTRNTLDRATAMLPKLLYQRLDQFGFDFVVLYPSAGLRVPFIAEPELRQIACRAFNTFSAELFREYSGRLTPAAVIPMHTPEEAVRPTRLEGCDDDQSHSPADRVFSGEPALQRMARPAWPRQRTRLRPGMEEMCGTRCRTNLPFGIEGSRYSRFALQRRVQPHRTFRCCRRGRV
jgi:hypothetical protein